MSQLQKQHPFGKRIPADMVLTLIFPLRPASKASTYINLGTMSKRIALMQNKDLMFENVHYYRKENPTLVSLSRAALAELMPPPYL